MIVSGHKTTATPDEAQQTQQTTSANPSGSGTLKATRISDLLTTNSRAPSLSSEGQSYMLKLLESMGGLQNRSGLKIEMREYAAPSAGRAFIANGVAVVLLFDELLTQPRDQSGNVALPKSLHLTEANNNFDKFVAADTGITRLNTIIVSKEDYELPDAMAYHIVSVLTANSLQDKTISAFGDLLVGGTSYVMETNLPDVMQMVATYVPHRTLARAEFGFILKARTGDRNNQQDQPLAAVTAYVEFVSRGGALTGTEQRFQPIVHITEIATPLPVTSLMTVLLPLCVEAFVKDGLWKKQFSSFAERKANIGQLFIHDGKPLFIGNQADVEDFIQNRVELPVLALDVPYGRAHIPGLEMYTDMSFTEAVWNEINVFLGTNLAPRPMPVTGFTEFTGSMIIDGRRVDTRAVDYFYVINRYDVPTAQPFLWRVADPTERFARIRELFGDTDEIRLLYQNQVAILDTQVLTELYLTVANHIPLLKDIQVQRQGINVGILAEQSKGFGQLYNTGSMFRTVQARGFGAGKQGGGFWNPSC